MSKVIARVILGLLTGSLVISWAIGVVDWVIALAHGTAPSGTIFTVIAFISFISICLLGVVLIGVCLGSLLEAADL